MAGRAKGKARVEQILDRACQRPGEPGHVTMAFRYWVSSADRSQAEVARVMGVTRTTVHRWVTKYDWHERAKVYDRTHRTVETKSILAAVEELPVPPKTSIQEALQDARDIRTALAGDVLVRAGMREGDARFSDMAIGALLHHAAKWTELIIRWEASAQLAGAIRDHGREQVKLLDDEELLALQRMQKKVKIAA